MERGRRQRQKKKKKMAERTTCVVKQPWTKTCGQLSRTSFMASSADILASVLAPSFGDVLVDAPNIASPLPPPVASGRARRWSGYSGQAPCVGTLFSSDRTARLRRRAIQRISRQAIFKIVVREGGLTISTVRRFSRHQPDFLLEHIRVGFVVFTRRN